MPVVNFLKSLFMPKRMQRFRYMSILISICLFVLTIYVFRLPINSYYSRNTHRLVEENNLYELQAIQNIPTVGTEITELVNLINEKQLTIEANSLVAKNLGVSSLVKGDNIVGVFTNNTETGYWYYDGVSTGVAVASEVIEKPNLVATNGGIVISNATSNPIAVEGITESDSLEVIKVTVNNRGLLSINDTIYNNLIIGSSLNVGILNDKLVVNDIITEITIDTSKKYFVYFAPNTNVTYFEKTLQYTGEDGYKKNISFVIDLSVDVTTQAKGKFDENTPFNGDLENEEYFYIEINKQAIYYQAHPANISASGITHADNKLLQTYALLAYFAYEDIDFSSFTVASFGQKLAEIIEGAYITAIQSSYVMTIIIYVVLFTLVISLLYFLLFKKQGKMKTFKEYYNIAAISNIVPTIITFIILWFIPDIFAYAYIFIFGSWYLYVCYRINNSPDIV